MAPSEKYTYRVIWSEKDKEHVGLVAEFPSLSWLAATPGEALSGITKLVDEVLVDMATSKETPPVPQNYIDKVAQHIGDQCGMEMEKCMIDPEGSRLLRIYAVLAMTVGVHVTWKHVHDAWSAWRAQSWPDHPSLVPFDQLTDYIKSLDAPYCDAIRSTAVAIQEGRL